MEKEEKNKSAKNKREGSLFFVAVVIFSIMIYVMSKYAPYCEEYECFQNAMKKCVKRSYINDQDEATYRYRIIGMEKGECIVNVKLLQAKKGSLNIESIVGYDMECSAPKGFAYYPERELDRCHGRLKEELQTILIEKLHTYIINNIGPINESLKNIK